MKKFTASILAVILLFGGMTLPVKTRAATLQSKAGAVTTNSSSLNVRAAASTGARVVTTLKKGSYVTLLSKSGSWWKVEYTKNKYGYCHADYITTIQGIPATVATNSNPLNVRSGPGTSYQRITALPKGEVVIKLATTGDWSRILYHGTKTGYVSTRYLSGGTGDSNGGTTGNGAISLAVPNFKQTDSRWANVTLGTSGKTIRDIGCATTAIAMMESYRTGTTIYPDAMSKKLSYTSSGNVYWPSHYVTVTQENGYLARIYELLKQGRPVLFGAKKASGGQHWVVVHGFSGGNLTASNFLIRDPGSASRTNLQQLLDTHPTFYKFFHY